VKRKKLKDSPTFSLFPSNADTRFGSVRMPPKLTQPLRPAARYRKGQAPVGAPASDSDSDQEDEQLEQPQSDPQDGSEDEVGVQEFTSGGNQRTTGKGKMGIKLDKVQVDQQGKVKVGGKDEVGRTEMESSEGEYG